MKTAIAIGGPKAGQTLASENRESLVIQGSSIPIGASPLKQGEVLSAYCVTHVYHWMEMPYPGDPGQRFVGFWVWQPVAVQGWSAVWREILNGYRPVNP